MIQHVMCCTCGVDTDCEPEDQAYGAVWQCPACKVVTACVGPREGRKAWVRVEFRQVEFYRLLRGDCPHCGAIGPDYCELARCEWDRSALDGPE